MYILLLSKKKPRIVTNKKPRVLEHNNATEKNYIYLEGENFGGRIFPLSFVVSKYEISNMEEA